jgi:hypothetical protein
VKIALGPFTGLYGIYRGGRRNHDLVELQLGQVCLPTGNLVAAELQEEDWELAQPKYRACAAFARYSSQLNRTC